MKITLPGAGNDQRFLAILNTIIGADRGSLIDLCCHHARLTQGLSFAQKTFVDVNDHSARVRAGRFVQADVVNGSHPVFAERYDVATCLDGIEHMHKPEGWQMLKRMDALAAKQILFTPLDPWSMDPDSTDPEAHKCVWSPDELVGYASIVMPTYHPTLGIGAFFFWKCDDIRRDFERVREELAALGV